jgi:hypothetical protein
MSGAAVRVRLPTSRGYDYQLHALKTTNFTRSASDRLPSSDYLEAVPLKTAEPTITGPVPSTPWDTCLRSAVDRLRVPVYEEQIRERLFGAMDASGSR